MPYSVLFYSKDSNDSHEAFLEASFHLQALMPAAEQTDTFQTLLTQSLGTECSLEVVQEMHETVSFMIAEQQKDKEAEALTLSKKDVARVLMDSGVSEEKVEAFENGFDEVFGVGTVLPAVNVGTPKQFKIDLPSVSVKVDPEHADLFETRVVDGRSYLLIPIEGDIAVNGQPVFAYALCLQQSTLTAYKYNEIHSFFEMSSRWWWMTIPSVYSFKAVQRTLQSLEKFVKIIWQYHFCIIFEQDSG